jgi:uridine kinase
MSLRQSIASYGLFKPWRDKPLFWLGLLLRIAACCLLVPQVQEGWFVPFMRDTLLSPSLDPWTSFIDRGGATNAFPYGPVMYLAHVPTVLGGILVDSLTNSRYFAQVGFSASLLLADFLVLNVLLRLFENRYRELLRLYWLSPIVLYITYYHGQTDIIPVAILLVALLMIKQQRLTAAGVFVGLSVCAKLSMLIVLPFILLYAWYNHQLAGKRKQLAVSLGVTLLLGQGIFLLSSGARTMLLSPEIGRIYQMALPLGDGQLIYLLILTYILVLYSVYDLRRINFELLVAVLGVGFLIVLTLSPAATGWFVWCVPFLVAYQMIGEDQQRPRIMVLAFGLLFVLINLLGASGAKLPLLGLDWTVLDLRDDYLGSHFNSILITLQTAAGLTIAFSMYRRGVSQNDFFKLSRRPIAIGIAGDSGSGKDTLSNALASLFSPGCVVAVSGDDYHRYERHSPMWQNMTHLDPRANDLKAFNEDILALIKGRAISCREYDHSTGRFTPQRQVKANDVILVSGLHALASPEVLQELDVSVYLDMDEHLRRFFKIKRDSGGRGHSVDAVQSSIEQRLPFGKKYIAPQSRRANLVLQLAAVDDSRLDDHDHPDPGPLKLRIWWRDATQCQDFARILIGLCGVGIDQQPPDEHGITQFELDAEEVAAEDFSLAARCLAPELEDLLAREPKWLPGVLGVMQLVVLVQLVGSIGRRK